MTIDNRGATVIVTQSIFYNRGATDTDIFRFNKGYHRYPDAMYFSKEGYHRYTNII